MAAYGFDEQSARRISEAVRRSEQELEQGSRRRRQVPISRGGTISILGPCAEYTPDEELPDTEFDVDFGDGCEGPSRYGMIYRSTVETAEQTKTVNIEKQSDVPLLYSSDTFSHDCSLSSLTLYVELEFTSLDMEDVELRFLKDSDDSLVATYQNTFYRWFPMQAGWLQCVYSDCSCVTFPYDICISVPTR